MELAEVILKLELLQKDMAEVKETLELVRRATITINKKIDIPKSDYQEYFRIYLTIGNRSSKTFTPLRELFDTIKPLLNYPKGIKAFCKELKDCGYPYATCQAKRGFYVTINKELLK